MQRTRLVTIGATLAATAAVCILGSGVASAASVVPEPGGVTLNLSHDETVAVSNGHVGQILGAMPTLLNLYDNVGAPYGEDLAVLAHHSASTPAGHLSLSFYGPVNDISWGMVAYVK
ncbi:hypothetical protein G4X40_06810 [Rhodococcus sp. D2-41]|uniref:Secreted protein n=1 Tax=Speluncibacter jeojiensis TaxID=2710754 RepID=A0A9X4LZS2_9ACTN|nr:hypothetical protein [Rhodococcus sp. D2-41]MDG3009855.1 hypothetical protein [Rhodococcus sp. D2-41]MDG3014606.1 hypothetical protein [Corynebacteriales bacterium D3-21]